MAPSTPVPPPSWPISPGGAGSPGPALRFALMFLYPRVGKFVSCLLCVPPAPIFKAIEKVYAIKAVASFLSGPRPFLHPAAPGRDRISGYSCPNLPMDCSQRDPLAFN